MKQKIKIIFSLFLMMKFKDFIILVFIASLQKLRIFELIFVKKLTGKKLSRFRDGIETFTSDQMVSVILPVNNGLSKGVEKLVASLHNQSHKNIEFIAVDSGSTDDTVSFLKNNGWSVIQINPSEFTHAFSRNRGAEYARGEYLLFVVDDAQFRNPEWIRSALYILTKAKADSLSSRQGIDNNADAYARVLSIFLSNSQSDQPSVNISRDSNIIRYLRKKISLKTQFRSVCIDDTNHLVKRNVFEKFKYAAPTVEDLEYALRLTQRGGRVVYTNLLSIVHYHTYDIKNIKKYANRVFIDTKTSFLWQPYYVRIDSRQEFLLAAVNSLSVVLDALDSVINLKTQLNAKSFLFLNNLSGDQKGVISDLLNSCDKSNITELLKLALHKSNNKIRILSNEETTSSLEAKHIYFQIIGDSPPSNIFFSQIIFEYFLNRFLFDIESACNGIVDSHYEYLSINDCKNICIHLWTNRLCVYLGRTKEVFKVKGEVLPIDSLDIGDWV